MTGKTDAFENDILKLFFKTTTITGLARDDAAPATNLYFSLHTATLDDSSTQATSEIAYTNYSRVAVARGSGFGTVSGGSVSPAAAVTFPQAGASGGATVTHFGVGTNATAGQAGYLMYWGTVTPNIVVSNGVTPQLTTASAITED